MTVMEAGEPFIRPNKEGKKITFTISKEAFEKG